MKRAFLALSLGFLISIVLVAVLVFSHKQILYNVTDRISDLYNNRSPIVWIRHTYNADRTTCILPDVYQAASMTWTNPNRWQQDNMEVLAYDARGIDRKVVRIEVEEGQILIDGLGNVYEARDYFEGLAFTLHCVNPAS